MYSLCQHINPYMEVFLHHPTALLSFSALLSNFQLIIVAVGLGNWHQQLPSFPFQPPSTWPTCSRIVDQSHIFQLLPCVPEIPEIWKKVSCEITGEIFKSNPCISHKSSIQLIHFHVIHGSTKILELWNPSCLKSKDRVSSKKPWIYKDLYFLRPTKDHLEVAKENMPRFTHPTHLVATLAVRIATRDDAHLGRWTTERCWGRSWGKGSSYSCLWPERVALSCTVTWNLATKQHLLQQLFWCIRI